MAKLTAVDYDPFAGKPAARAAAPTLTPVDYDPFGELGAPAATRQARVLPGRDLGDTSTAFIGPGAPDYSAAFRDPVEDASSFGKIGLRALVGRIPELVANVVELPANANEALIRSTLGEPSDEGVFASMRSALRQGAGAIRELGYEGDMETAGFGVPSVSGGELVEALNPNANANRAKAAEEFGEPAAFQPLTLGERAGRVARFIPETLLASAPDMVATLNPLTLAGYVGARTNEIAEERAANDYRADVSLGDLGIAAPSAAVEALLERFTTMRLLPQGTTMATPGVLPAIGRIAKELGLQGSLGGIEELAPYLAETVGTETRPTGQGALEAFAGGAIAEGALGGGVQSGKEALRAAQGGRVPPASAPYAQAPAGAPAPAQAAPVAADSVPADAELDALLLANLPPEAAEALESLSPEVVEGALAALADPETAATVADALGGAAPVADPDAPFRRPASAPAAAPLGGEPAVSPQSAPVQTLPASETDGGEGVNPTPAYAPEPSGMREPAGAGDSAARGVPQGELTIGDPSALDYNLSEGTTVGGADEIRTLANAARAAAPTEKSAIRYATVSEEVASLVREEAGIDVSGYRHVVDASALRHAIKAHSSEATEASRGQEPLTDDDFALIPEIVADPDAVESMGKDKIGRDLLRYRKRFNGTTYYVEEVRTRRRELAAKTMWKVPTRDVLPAEASERPTPEATGGDLPRGDSTTSTPEAAADSPDGPLQMGYGKRRSGPNADAGNTERAQARVDRMFSGERLEQPLDGLNGAPQFVTRGRTEYLADERGEPRDFLTESAAQQEARRVGGRVLIDDAIEGQRPTWSVIRPAVGSLEASTDLAAGRDTVPPEGGDQAAPEQGNERGLPGPAADRGDAAVDDAGGAGRRPDFLPRLARNAALAVESLVRRYSGSVLADRIRRDYVETRTAQLVGQRISSEADLAALAEVYRNPAFETMRYLYVDNDGQVLGETAVSLREPGITAGFPDNLNGTEAEQWVVDSAPKGATGVWLLHNHPSGNPTPSQQDQDFTALLALRLGDKQGAPKVRGHVIINHATYGRIAPDGTARPNASIAKIGPDPLLDARGATDVLGERFIEPSRVAALSQRITALTPDNSVAVVVLDAKGLVNLMFSLPAEVLSSPRGAAVLSRVAKRSGAEAITLVANASVLGDVTPANLKQIESKGLVYDLVRVNPDGTTDSLIGGGYRKNPDTGRREPLGFRNRKVGTGNRRRAQQVFQDTDLEQPLDLTPQQTEAMAKAGLPVDRRSALQRARDRVAEEWSKLREAARDSDALKQATFDRFHGLRMAEAQLGLNDPELSPYIAARMTAGIASNMEGLMLYGAPKWDGGVLAMDGDTKGLLDSLKPVEGKIDEFLGWMVGRRAKLLKAQGRENNLTDVDIAALLSLADGNEAAFQQAAKDYLKIKNAVLDVAEQAGLIDPAARAAWDHAEYIPFYRAENDAAIGPGTRKGLAGQTSGIRTLKGGDQALADPLANIVRNFAKLLDAAGKNRATLLAVDQLGAKFFQPASREFQPASIPLDQVKRHLKEQGVTDNVIAGMPPAALKGVQRMLSIVPPTGENVVRVMRDGKAEYYTVSDPLVLRALTAFKPANKNIAMKPLIWFKRLLTTGVTTTAEFVGANFIRDSGSAWVISDDRFVPGWDSLKGVGNTLRNDSGTRDMMMAGATFLGGNFYDGNPDEAAAALRRALRKKGMANRDIEGFMGTVARTPLQLWDGWLKLSGAVENANRRAVYDAALKAGRSRTEAAFIARDLMDFSMQGDAAMIQFFADVLPFFNARLQGLYKLGRRSGTKEGKRAIILRGGTLALASAALYAWNVTMHAAAYGDLEEWDKDAYWHIAPGTEYHVRIPKPFEIGVVFATAPERAMEAMRFAMTGENGDKPSTTWESLVRALAGTLSFNPIPQAVLPLMEQWANKRFFTGRAIENMGDEKLLPEARAEWYSSETMKAISKLVGNETELSPKRLEHLWNGYTAGLGGYVLDASDAIVRKLQDAPTRPEMALREMPISGRFLRGGSPALTKYQGEFYELLRNTEQIEQTVKEYTVAGRQAEADKLAAENAELLGERVKSKQAKGGFMFAKPKALRKVRSQLSEIREEIEGIATDRSLSAQEKRSKIDSLTAKRNRIVKDAVKGSGQQPVE